MSKKNSILKAGMGYTIGNYLLKGINFLTVPIFTRLMSTVDYGTYNIYMTYDGIITIFMALALHSSINSAKSRYREKIDEYLSSILILPVLILGGTLLAVNVFFPTFHNLCGFNRLILNTLLCHSFANSIIQIYNNRLGLDYQYKGYLKISFANTFLNLTLSITLMYTLFSNAKYEGRIIGSALPMIGISAYIYFITFRRAKPRFDLDYWKFGLTYSLPIIPHGLSQIILSSFDKIMIKRYVSTSCAGIYSLGVNIEQLVKITTTSLNSVWVPWFYQKMDKKDYASIKKNSTIYAYGMFVLLGCLIFASPEMVQFMGSKEYQDAKYVVAPLLTSTYFIFLYSLPSTVEYYFQKTKMIAVGTMCAAVVNIVLNFIFIRRYGYIAAAYTTLFSYVLYFVCHYNVAKIFAGKQMFSTGAIICFICGIFCVAIFTLLFLEHFWVRLIVGIFFLLVNVIVILKFIVPGLIKKDNHA